MKRLLTLPVTITLILLLLLAADYLVKDQKSSTIDAQKVKSVLLNKKEVVDECFKEIAAYDTTEYYSIQQLFNELPFKDVVKDGFAYAIVQNGYPIFWSDNTVPYHAIDTLSETGIKKVGNGWYWIVKKEIKNAELYGLILIKQEYSYKNEYIQDAFHSDFELPPHIQVVKDAEQGVQISDRDGNFLFSLVPSEYKVKSAGTLLVAIAFLVIFFLLLWGLYRNMKRQQLQKRSWLLLFIFAVLLFAIRIIMLHFEIPRGLYNLRIFDPLLYASSSFIPSLGDLLLMLISIWFIFYLLISLFNQKSFKIPASYAGRLGFLIFLLIVNAAWFNLSYNLLRSIIYNSSISLSLYNFLNLSIYSAFALFAILLIIVNYIFLVYFLTHWIRQFMNFKYFMIILLIFIVLVSGVALVISERMQLVTIFYCLVVNVLIALFVFRYPTFHYSRNMLLLFVSVLFLTFFTENHSTTKEQRKRKILVTNLENERDRIGEYLLRGLEEKIKQDEYIHNLMKHHLDNEFKIFDYLRSEFFSGYFRKYDMQISVCDPRDELEVDGEDIYHCYSFFAQMLREEGIPISNSHFYFLDNMNGRISYMGMIRFHDEEWDRERTLYIALDSKLTNTHLGYPELLLDEELIKPGPLDDYAFAKYKADQLIRRAGDFAFPMELSSLFKTEDPFVFINYQDYNHLIYQANDNTTIIISKPGKGFLDMLAQFSYIFAFFYILFILFVFFLHFPANIRSFNNNFKNKIKLSMILLLFLSLIAVGTGTVYYTTQQFQQKQKETISEKLQSILVELESKLGVEPELYPEYRPYLTELLTKFSNVFYIDMNLYDLNGELLASSRPQIFEQDLLGRRMNPLAFQELTTGNQPRFIHTEKLGRLKYHSAYVPFYNIDGEKLAYLNLPYFTRQQALQREIYTLVMVMVNIYVFLIILGIIIAVFVSNKITRPLRLIRQKLRKIALNQTNEKIDYSSHDEVGDLISEYNRMVDELEDNARKLAQTERESAWREMAKQIAHEIKNPLTPMKLKVQYLKRAWDDQVSDFNERMKTFTDSMISQINNLSGIATEFSNFAKMPRAKNSKISIREQANNMVSLYENTENVTIQLEDYTEGIYYVYADASQISRVLNNLLKNAIQSIPRSREGKVIVSLQKTDHRVLISVADNGEGIPENIRGKLFAPNFTTKSSGMGMGLAISRKIVEDSGGKIWYETKMQQGTTFYVELPIYGNSAQDADL